MSNAPSSPQTIALAFLASQNNEEQNVLDQIARLKAENARLAAEQAAKPKAPKAKKASPIHGKSAAVGMPTAYGIPLPDKGTLSPVEFMSAMQNAGKRSVLVKLPNGEEQHQLQRQESEVRNDQIKAIAGFVGYDTRGLFGPQESAARATAQRMMKASITAGPSREEQRAADLSAKGFVAGMPKPLDTKLANLHAREELAAEAMIRHEKEAADMARSADQRELSDGLAQVERERISHIRQEIARLTFK